MQERFGVAERRASGLVGLPTRPNEGWALDCVSDTLAWGRLIRSLTVVDCFTREAWAIELDTSLPGARPSCVWRRVNRAA